MRQTLHGWSILNATRPARRKHGTILLVINDFITAVALV